MRNKTIFIELGNQIDKIINQNTDNEALKTLQLTIAKAQHINHWFSEANCLEALKGIRVWLEPENLSSFFTFYALSQVVIPKTVLVITPSNIPFVGFHDVFCVLATGNKVIVKPSSNDAQLLETFLLLIKTISEEFYNQNITVQSSIVKKEDFEAVIATGSNNTGRYFEAYFGHLPNIIRKNRNSLAILTGKETKEELYLLGKDIFQYYGLGCRNVTQIRLPINYDFNVFFEAIEPHKPIIHHGAYCNNYTYHKALYSMNLVPFFDNNFLLLREDQQLHSPIGVLHYSYYSTPKDIEQYLEINKEQIQCTVGHQYIAFGETQQPNCFQYADNVDTVQFLLTL